MNLRPTAACLRAFLAAAGLALCSAAAARLQALPPVRHGAPVAKPFVLEGARFADSHLIVQLAPGVRVAADRKLTPAALKASIEGGPWSPEDARARGLIDRIGLERVEALEADQTPRKWTIDELQAIKKKYQEKARELQKTLA